MAPLYCCPNNWKCIDRSTEGRRCWMDNSCSTQCLQTISIQLQVEMPEFTYKWAWLFSIACFNHLVSNKDMLCNQKHGIQDGEREWYSLHRAHLISAPNELLGSPEVAHGKFPTPNFFLSTIVEWNNESANTKLLNSLCLMHPSRMSSENCP